LRDEGFEGIPEISPRAPGWREGASVIARWARAPRRGAVGAAPQGTREAPGLRFRA
jgi:hypothetical protein